MIQVKSPTMGIQHIKRDQEEPEIFRFHLKITKTPTSTTCYVSERRPLFTLSTLFYEYSFRFNKHPVSSLLYIDLNVGVPSTNAKSASNDHLPLL